MCKHYVPSERGIEEGNCSNGQVRLESGSLGLVRDGRVEVCVNRVWGTVCSEQFSEDDAQVVCSQMNFERSGECVAMHGYLHDYDAFHNTQVPCYLTTQSGNDLVVSITTCRSFLVLWTVGATTEPLLTAQKMILWA